MHVQATPVARLQLGGHHRTATPNWALIDAADFDWLSQWKWSYVRGYGYRHVTVDGKKTTMLLHRQILGLEFGDPLQADHVNRDRLDNRRCNLRIVPGAHNWQNTPSRGGTSRYRGVSWCPRGHKKWIARAKFDGKQHRLGRYETEEEAAAAALAARLQHMSGAVD